MCIKVKPDLSSSGNAYPFLLLCSSGRKRRGSETFSDSSGDEFFTGFKDISPQTTSAAVINTNPASSTSSGVTITKPREARSSSSSGGGYHHANGRSSLILGNRSSSVRGGGESEECTAALVLMNLSHSPSTSGGGAPLLHGGGTMDHSILHDKAASVSHQGHVRCLPGGACLVGEPASKMHPDHNKQVQGKFP